MHWGWISTPLPPTAPWYTTSRINWFYNQALPSTVAAELIAMERDPSIHINVYYGDEWLVEEELPWLLKFHHDSGFSYRLADLASHPMTGSTRCSTSATTTSC